jgi:hypothetical protein
VSKQLETFVRNNRQALDNAKPDPSLWEELSEYANKPAKFSFRRWLQKIKAWFF